MKSEVYKGKVNKRDKLVAHIMNGADLLKQECLDYLRRASLLNYLLTPWSRVLLEKLNGL
jgi:hypothetical protein